MLRRRLFLVNIVTVTIITLALSGCGGGKLLRAVGLKKDEPPPPPPTIPVRIYAGTNLNAGDGKKASAAVIKVYHLRSGQRFERAPFSAFLDQAGEQAALGADLLSVNEIVLMPGMRQELKDKLSDGETVIGVVALFREPAKDRWRLTFDATHKELPSQGITVGVHACAMTTSSGALISSIADGAGSLVSVRCTATR